MRRVLFCLPLISLLIITILIYNFNTFNEDAGPGFLLILTCSLCLFVLAWFVENKQTHASKVEMPRETKTREGTIYKMCIIGISIVMLISFFMPWFIWLDQDRSSAWKLSINPTYKYSQSSLRYIALFIPICGLYIIYYQIKIVQTKVFIKRLLFCTPLVLVLAFASLVRFDSPYLTFGSHYGDNYHILDGLLIAFISSFILFILAWFRGSKKTI